MPGFAVLEAIVRLDKTMGIEKDPDGIGEVEPTLDIACLALGFVPFELHPDNVGQRTTFASSSRRVDRRVKKETTAAREDYEFVGEIRRPFRGTLRAI
jgi:hypothetical protein